MLASRDWERAWYSRVSKNLDPSEEITQMLSEQSDDQYRRLPLGEKLRLTLEMCRRHEPCLLVGTPDQVRRKFELIRRENNLRNANMLAAFAQSDR